VAHDQIDELDALARRADALASETIEQGPSRGHAMARALALRLKALAAGVRLAIGCAMPGRARR
jgi:hypothetical protein